MVTPKPYPMDGQFVVLNDCHSHAGHKESHYALFIATIFHDGINKLPLLVITLVKNGGHQLVNLIVSKLLTNGFHDKQNNGKTCFEKMGM